MIKQTNEIFSKLRENGLDSMKAEYNINKIGKSKHVEKIISPRTL